MTSRNGITITVTAVICLGAGVLIGMQMAAGGRASTAARVPAQTGSSEMRSLQAENARLRDQLSARATSTSAAAAKQEAARVDQLRPIDKLRVLVDLRERRLMQPLIHVTNYNTSELGNSFVALFDLTATEADTLQRSINASRDKLTELETVNSSVEEQADGSLVISINPYPAAGGAVYDDLLRSFAATLGPDRQKAFLALAATDLERSLGYMGAADRKLTISPDANGTGFRVSEQHKLPTQSGSSSTSCKTLADVSKWAGSAAALIPPTFGRPK